MHPFLPTGLLGCQSADGLQLQSLSQASEFKDFRVKPNERPFYRHVNKLPFILYPIKETVGETWHKISLLVQLSLGGVELPNEKEFAGARRQAGIDKTTVFERMQCLARCFAECRGADGDATGVKLGLELSRALGAGSWEGRPTQLLQVPGIGPAGMRKLVSQGVRTVLGLADKSDADIERLLSHKPPYGRTTNQTLAKFPRLTLEMAVMGQKHLHRGDHPAIEVNIKATLGCTNSNGGWWTTTAQGTPIPPRITFFAETTGRVLVFFWNGTMKKLDKRGAHDLSFSAVLVGGEDVRGHFSCESVVGTTVARDLRFHNPLPAPEYHSTPDDEMTVGVEYPGELPKRTG